MNKRGKFAGGDQAYLRDVQYADSAKLAARLRLHVKYGQRDWYPWWAQQISWPPTAEVLEVGCGAGWVWVEAAGHIPDGLRLMLTDQSSGMVAEALDHVGSIAKYDSVQARVADAQDLPFDTGSFDVVVANHMLYHLPDPSRGVAELARLLRADGVGLIATNGRGHLRELWDLRSEVFPEMCTGWDETVDVFGIEAAEPLLRDRFAEVELRRFPDVLRCTDPSDVLAYIRSVPPAEDATEDETAALHAAVESRFEQGNGVFEVTKDVGLFICGRPHDARR
jgi:ubiquinone/menaquinone biosynthesis C-methylase UbiE